MRPFPSVPTPGGGSVGGGIVIVGFLLLLIGLFAGGVWSHIATTGQQNTVGQNFTNAVTIQTCSGCHGTTGSVTLVQGLGAFLPIGLALFIFEERRRRRR